MNLPEFKDAYATILDNVFTPAECSQLLTLAESTTSGSLPGDEQTNWERALVNTGNNTQKHLPDVRNCDRIIWDDAVVVGRIWDRCKGHVPEMSMEVLEGNANVMGNGPVKRGERFVASRLNERMRVLRYTGGEYFNGELRWFTFLVYASFRVLGPFWRRLWCFVKASERTID